MIRLASVLTVLLTGTAHAQCHKAAVVVAAPVHHQVYHAPHVVQVVTLAVPVALVTPYPVTFAGGTAAPAESAELKQLRDEIAAMKQAAQAAALKEQLRAEILRELQVAPPPKK